MARAVRKGALSFGLVNTPLKVIRAKARGKTVTLEAEEGTAVGGSRGPHGAAQARVVIAFVSTYRSLIHPSSPAVGRAAMAPLIRMSMRPLPSLSSWPLIPVLAADPPVL